MPRATVRAALQAYIQQGISDGAIPSLSTVFPHPPKVTQEGDIFANQLPGFESGAVMYIHLIEHDERRIAIGGAHSGRKARPYRVALICVLRNKSDTTQAAGEANDAFLDGVTAWIQADRNAGDASVVFQWGEGDEDSGTYDIVVKAGMPKPFKQQTSQVFSTVEVTVLEILVT